MRFLRLLLPAQDIAAAFAARSMADLHTGGSRIAESTASSRVGGRGGGAVLNTAADAIVNELSLLGTLCRRVRLLGSAEGYRAVSSRGILNLDARGTGVAKASGGCRSIEA